MEFITPKNWGDFQHYKNRSPAWIKLHRNILDNRDFHRLPVASRALAPMLWLLASEYESGKIPLDYDLIAFRLRLTEDEVRSALSPLISKGFFTGSQDASNVLAECLPREEKRREEKEGEEEKIAPAKPASIRATDLVGMGVQNNVAEAYLHVRKTKRGGPLTELALSGIKREAAKAGLTLEQALTKCVERSWVGFEAEWVSRSGAIQSTTLADHNRAVMQQALEQAGHTGGKHD